MIDNLIHVAVLVAGNEGNRTRHHNCSCDSQYILFHFNINYLLRSTIARVVAVAAVLYGFAQQFLLPHNKVGRYTLFFNVERLLYALGAGWQGRVKLEVQNQTHSPCIGTLSFLPRHNGAPNLCGASSDEIHTFCLIVAIF